MTSNEAVLAVIRALEATATPYMLVGAYSCNAYGVPRSTRDADFVVQLPPDGVQRVVEKLGPQFRLETQMSFETITGTLRHILHVAESQFRVELFHLSDDPHDAERFARRRPGPFMSSQASFPSAEDVVIVKLRWSRQGKRPKDIEDVRNIVAVQGDALDWPYIERWCDQHGTRALLDEVRRSIPPI